jgi:asparagine synthase (glutamine-hydrolysing)
MCGIYGFTLDLKSPLQSLKKMGKTMLHRGPDGEGHFLNSNISMGMRRLSIIDLDKGNQPFYSNDENIVAFCNGEIYNFQSLKIELQDKGYEFRTNSDVEVIPHLFSEYGIDFIHKLNGMFSISIYNKKDDKLYLIRDRLGIKPLYYSLVKNSIIYSSEIRPILSLKSINEKIDYRALSVYLDLMYIPKPMTPFKNIKKLDSGSYMVFSKGKYKIKKYWSCKSDYTKSKTETNHRSEIHELLNDSVKMQLVSDVPIGSFLSGGIDSSFVTASAAKSKNKADEFSVFHMHWNDISGKIDESKYADMVADKYNLTKVFKDVNNIDLIKLIPKLIYSLEEPFADAAFIPTYFLSNIASKKVKVILSGAGGDELFGGYSHHKKYSKFKSTISEVLYGKNKSKSYYDRWKRGTSSYWKGFFSWYNPDDFKTSFEKKFINNKNIDELNSVMLNDIEYYLQDDILFLTDKMTMATSLECRVPLLDHRIVEKSQTIPSSLKIKNGEKKYLFKKISEEYVQKDVLYRKKEGFGFPIEKWINEYKELYFDVLLENGYLKENNLIDSNKLNSIIIQNSLDKDTSWFYWQIIVLEIWFQLYVVGKSHDKVFDFK